ncbi:SNF2-related protein [Bifidobacterium sp. ESL0800]|uniref:DEAD/DEAH box helicase n=1 Tax=Bifidobacterium sp. ESL0800 TaxID=2983236 RepID=UPI0023F7B2AF|nr:SNF2-related protein [Bifidobacterium sp. ESL0800]WEV75836.1 SNF2-related protein [Bifidobacterium sp. ESL0800]
MDWHASVYGSRTGSSGGFGLGAGSGDDTFGGIADPDGGVTFGANEPAVPEKVLRQRGGKSFYRAYEVISSGRMHDLTCTPGEDGTLLAASVEPADEFADDYAVSARIDENHGEIIDADCTCPAFGRFGAICKHVIALIMQYNDTPQKFEELGNGVAASGSRGNSGVGARRQRVVRRTSRVLRSFMEQEDSALAEQAKNRQLDLLKEVSSRASGDIGSGVALSRHMPIGSVVLRPMLENSARDWYLRLHIAVPSKGISYVVKDVRALVEAVQRREFVTYGKKLAFVHSRDSFDERSRSILAILGRAIEIRKSVSGDYEFYQSKAEAQEMRLSDDETAELLDLFVDADVTLDYVPAHGSFAAAVPVRVVDGDPDLGLEVVRVDDEGDDAGNSGNPQARQSLGQKDNNQSQKYGYVIRHALNIQIFIIGRGSSFVVVGSPAAGHSLDLDTPEIHRCSSVMTTNRNLLGVLCAGDERGDLYLSSDDIEEFSRTVLPALDPVPADGGKGGEKISDAGRAGDGDSADNANGAGNAGDGDNEGETGHAGEVDNPGSGVNGDGRVNDGNDADDNGNNKSSVSDGTDAGQSLQGATAGPVASGSSQNLTDAIPGSASVVSDDLTPATSRGTSHHGIAVKLPPELIKMRRVPCHIETYLDRDRKGITCDVQARYGDERFHVFSGIGPNEPVARDRETERLAVEAVRQYFPMPDGPIARIDEDNDKAIYKLLNEGLPVLRGLGEVFSTPSFDGLTSSPHPVFKIGLSIKSGLVEISPIADEIDPSEVPALLNSYRKRRKFHRLRNGAFVNMADVDTSKLDEVSSDLGLKPVDLDSGAVSVPAYEAYYLDNEADDEDKSDEFRSYLNDLRVIDPKTYKVPKSLAHVLRPYQVEGFRWLNAVADKGFGGILADEMGLGKTVQMLSYLVSRRSEQRQIGPNLIVCPASLVYNWAAECAKFAPELNVQVLAGSKAARRATLKNTKAWYEGRKASGVRSFGPATGEWHGKADYSDSNSGNTELLTVHQNVSGAQQASFDMAMDDVDLLSCNQMLAGSGGTEPLTSNLQVAGERLADSSSVSAARVGNPVVSASGDDGWQSADSPQPLDDDDIAASQWVAPDVLITSYDLLRRDIDDYDGLKCYCMTLDEAQYIKNHATKSARAVRTVAARHHFALTGTPIENRLSELWSIFDFLMPGMLGAYKHFRDRFEMPILSGDENAQRKLQAFVGPFILRRLKSQVLKDLPDKIENVLTVQLEGEQRKLYAALEQQLRATLNKQRDIEYKTGKIQILAQLTRLRQACCDPRLLFSNVGSNVVKKDAHVWGMPSRETERADDEPIDEYIDELSETADASANAIVGNGGLSGAGRGSASGSDASMASKTDASGKAVGDGDAATITGKAAGKATAKPRKVTSAKLDAIEELVSSCQDAGRKMLIFSQFTSFLDLIAERLRKNHVAYNVITGATPKRKRLELVDQFNADDTPVFLISLKAGNTGLNLTGACVVVHADPWWNAAAQEQATDRAHRIGQTQDVNVYQIVAKDTIEERILKMQQSKSDLAHRFVDKAGTGSATGISNLTKDDLLQLLG